MEKHELEDGGLEWNVKSVRGIPPSPLCLKIFSITGMSIRTETPILNALTEEIVHESKGGFSV